MMNAPLPAQRGRGRVVTAVTAALLLTVAVIALLAVGRESAAQTLASASTAQSAAPTAAAHAHDTEPAATSVPIELPDARPVTPPEADSSGEIAQTSLGDAVAEAPPQDRAAALGAPRPPVAVKDVMPSSGSLGGCLEEYGEDGQCVPAVPPSLAEHAAEMTEAGVDPASMSHPWTCAELRLLFPDGVAVRVPGQDPQGLDADEDGVACEPD